MTSIQIFENIKIKNKKDRIVQKNKEKQKKIKKKKNNQKNNHL